MFGLRSCRSSLLVGCKLPSPSTYAVRYSTNPSSTSLSEPVAYDDEGPTTSGLVSDLNNDTDSGPPTAGEKGVTRGLPSYKTQNVPMYKLYLQSTKTNTITTFTTDKGNAIAWYSGGSCGFKRGQRASYEAGYQCSVRMFKRIEEVAKRESFRLEMFFKGFGAGREAMQKALLTSEGEFVRPLVTYVVDKTPIKIGGTRAKKRRRM